MCVGPGAGPVAVDTVRVLCVSPGPGLDEANQEHLAGAPDWLAVNKFCSFSFCIMHSQHAPHHILITASTRSHPLLTQTPNTHRHYYYLL